MNNSATEIATAVRQGKRRALEVVEESLAEIAAREDELHCFNLVLFEQARARAAELDAAIEAGADPGVLAGVPVALKDNLCTRGIETTCSSRILEGWHPPYDATVVARLREAGAVFIGKTNLDEFAMGSSTENSANGPTRNPWALDKVPGGSSGGSAAAVAAGFVPIALGSDTGGSIRQPASLCGVVGLKPTYGSVSRYGLVAFASSLDQIGPLSCRVEDAALCFEVIAGHDPLDTTSLDETPSGALAAVERGVEGRRIGVISDFLSDASGEVAAAVRLSAERLAGAGAEIEEVSIPELLHGLSAYYVIAPAEASSNLARYDGMRYGLRVEGRDAAETNARTRAEGFGAEVKRRIMLGTYVLSAGYYDAYYATAQRVRTLVSAAFSRTYDRFDALVGPTSPQVAFGFGDKTSDPLSMYLADLYTIPSNLAGHPAISVPFALSTTGLPIGVQVLGPASSEAVLFAVAGALESLAQPGARGPVGAAVAR